MRFLWVLMSSVLFSCVGNEFMGGVDFKDNEWRAEQSAIFAFDTKKMSDKTLNVDIFVRYLAFAQGRDVTLYIKTQNSAKVFYIDTIAFKLAGDTEGSIRTVKVPYRQNVRWSTPGVHDMSISPSENLDGVMSVGVEIF